MDNLQNTVKKEYKKRILQFIEEKETVNCNTIVNQFNISWNTARNYLNELVIDKELIKSINGRNNLFKINNGKENHIQDQSKKLNYKNCRCETNTRCPVCKKERKTIRNVKVYKNLKGLAVHLTSNHKNITEKDRKDIDNTCELVCKAVHIGMIGKFNPECLVNI